MGTAGAFQTSGETRVDRKLAVGAWKIASNDVVDCGMSGYQAELTVEGSCSDVIGQTKL